MRGIEMKGKCGLALAVIAVTALGSVWGSADALGQTVAEHRAVPAGVTAPADFERAIERGWRSRDGSPGHAYWQQWSGYDITATLDPTTGVLEGSVQILYAHDAPANIQTVWLHLHQNIHQAGAPRLEALEVTDGVTIKSLAADGEELEERPLAEGPGYRITGTLMEVRPTIQLEPGDTLQLDIDWEVTLPQNGVGRMGHSDREMYFVAYWFPKLALFDNIRGWNAQPYLGNAEFYDEFSDYDVAIRVPVDWTVMATGTLQNPDEVLSALTIERLAQAATSDEAVLIAGQAERDARTVTADSDDGWLTYRFSADRVRDFAWTTSNVQRWDATSAVVADRDEDGQEDRVLIHSFWRPERAPLWSEQWEYAKQSIEHHSTYTGFPYPWPHMTSVEGADIIGGGMEFPMLTLIGPYEGGEAQALFNVTSHELAHMWIPMSVGTDEKRYAWIDEGSTTFLENQSRMQFWPGVDHHRVEARSYLQLAAPGLEQSMMRHGDYYEPGPGYGIASYAKPATLMVALREVMGRERWEEAYRTFISEWAFKHPAPWDFFNTFERFAERDLDWFWTSFYYETWTLDQAVGSVVTAAGGGATVEIEDRGSAPYPSVVRIRTSNGTELQHEIPVEHWLKGNKTYEIEVAPEAGPVRRVEIDPSGYAPDVDRSNNYWPRG
jgi:hypothetical protein